ncbi:hypothetical protein BRADI_5g17397v3 [Brachypodium distachyon]|uniref:Uncharacterized protein n=1 Tax=Brachypodium distachyon TaxID=15368 RepID=A0A0Q3E7N4_BRADI|nr:hypothetical protein BRADI_5g17397v3 [Brachypodium distachyon]
MKKRPRIRQRKYSSCRPARKNTQPSYSLPTIQYCSASAKPTTLGTPCMQKDLANGNCTAPLATAPHNHMLPVSLPSWLVTNCTLALEDPPDMDPILQKYALD